MEETTVVSIYLVRNTADGKVYVGKTEKDVEKRWHKHQFDASNNSGYYLHSAIRKHGIEHFIIQKIDEAPTHEEGCALEKKYIQFYQSDSDEFGYNLTKGGDGVSPNEETRRKISETHKRIGTIGPGRETRHYDEAWRQAVSRGCKGRKSWSEGKKFTPEHRAKLSESHIRIHLPEDKVVRMYFSEGLSTCAVAKHFGVSAKTISRFLKKAGMVLRPVGFQKSNTVSTGIGNNVRPLSSGSTNSTNTSSQEDFKK